MSTKRKLIGLGILVGAVLLLAAACGGEEKAATPIIVEKQVPVEVVKEVPVEKIVTVEVAAPTPTPVPVVKIGVNMGLTGPIGAYSPEIMSAARTAVDLVNNAYPDINIPLAATTGLPNLGGAKAELVVRDNQSTDDLTRTIAEQLIKQDKVDILDHAGSSGQAGIIQPVAEQAGIIFTCNYCSSPSLTARGFQWFFRVGPHDGLMVKNEFDFLKAWEAKGGPKVSTMAHISDSNLFGNDSKKLVEKFTAEAGIKLVENLVITTGSPTLDSEAQRLASANADVLFTTIYQTDATTLFAAFKRLGYMPPLIMTNDGAYSFTTFLEPAKETNLAVGWMGRDPTAMDTAAQNPNWVKVNEIYKKYSGATNMGELAMRSFTGTWADLMAINKAGSLDPAKMREGFRTLDIPASDLIIAYRGIKFDETGQNTLAGGVVTQVGWDGEKHTVYPFEASDWDPIYPMPTWAERAAHPTPTPAPK